MFGLGFTSQNDNVAYIGQQQPECLADCPQGIVAGTKVATPQGWRVVEAVAPGDQVLTFDGGMQTVVQVKREVIYANADTDTPESWPLTVPADALGNAAPLTLMPKQAVLVESDTAESVFGDPFAMLPAEALDGFRGITRCKPHGRFEVVVIQFARDEVIFANVGALFFCPRAVDMLEVASEPADYNVMPLEQADLLVSFLEEEDAGSVSLDEAKTVFNAAA